VRGKITDLGCLGQYNKLSEPEKRARLHAYSAARMSGGSRKSTPEDVKYSYCGCCPMGLIIYPKSIKDVLDTNCHSEFKENFGMFLRKKKDKNTVSNWRYKLKNEQRMVFASMTARMTTGTDTSDSPFLGEVGKRFYSQAGSGPPYCEWVGGLLTGFDQAQPLIKHLKDLFQDSRKAVKSELVVSGHNWVVEQLDLNLKEYKEFRDGLEEEERKEWDRMVKKEAWQDGSGNTHQFEGITREDFVMQKEIEDRVRLMMENMFPGSMVGGSHSGAMLSTKCWYCQKESGQLHKCSRCLNAMYCDEKCQSQDWDAHRGYCNKVKKERKQKKDGSG